MIKLLTILQEIEITSGFNSNKQLFEFVKKYDHELTKYIVDDYTQWGDSALNDLNKSEWRLDYEFGEELVWKENYGGDRIMLSYKPVEEPVDMIGFDGVLKIKFKQREFYVDFA